MPTILTISSVETLMRMNSIPSNIEDSYNTKIDKLKNVGLLMKNEQYSNKLEKNNQNINNPDSFESTNNRGIIVLNKPSKIVFTPVKSKYDQLISGDINITFNNGIYRIIFLRNSPFTLYQVWSDSDNTINKTRTVRQMDAENWINKVFNINRPVKFTPTAIMDTTTERYIFIIKNIYIKNNKLVFEIPNSGISFQGCISTYLSNNLPLGTLMNVRFDIDSIDFSSGSYTITEDTTISDSLNITSSDVLTIQEGSTLTITNNAIITNNGTIRNNGTINGGSITNNGGIENTGTINNDSITNNGAIGNIGSGTINTGVLANNNYIENDGNFSITDIDSSTNSGLITTYNGSGNINLIT